VSSALNRAALADYFLDRFPRLEETFFEAVKRVPPGHVLRLTGQTARLIAIGILHRAASQNG
jgi:hypothetical protein